MHAYLFLFDRIYIPMSCLLQYILKYIFKHTLYNIYNRIHVYIGSIWFLVLITKSEDERFMSIFHKIPVRRAHKNFSWPAVYSSSKTFASCMPFEVVARIFYMYILTIINAEQLKFPSTHTHI